MAGVRHKKVSPIADGTDTNQVRPSDWNADHDMANLIRVTEQDFGSVAIGYKEWTVSDSDVLSNSRVRAWLAVEATAANRDGVAADADEAIWEPMNVNVENIAAGSFLLSAEALDGPVDGPYKFHYMINN